MSNHLPSEQTFTDDALIDMARMCLEHAMQSLAIRDCQCHSCKGFMQETPGLVALLRKRLRLEPAP